MCLCLTRLLREIGCATTRRCDARVESPDVIELITFARRLQAMDIAGLSKLTGDTVVFIISILGFMVRFDFAKDLRVSLM